MPRRASTVRIALCALAWLVAGCDGPAPPWEQPGAPPVPAPRASGRAGPFVEDTLDVDEPRGSEPYARCLEGLRPTDDPVRDVVRLGTTCGPSTGMRRVTDVPQEGVVSDRGPPLALRARLVAGRCYRVFLVAEPALEQVSLELRSSRGTTLARDRSAGRVVVLQPEGPVCAAGDDDATLVVAARRGGGRFALELWWHEASSRADEARAPDE